jgi:hypothetical protein
VFGASDSGVLSNGVLPSRKVIVPMGLGKAWPGVRETLFGWTVAVRPTLAPAATEAGLAVTVVVALVCPVAALENTFSINNKAGKESRWRKGPHLHLAIKPHG